jgi:1-acyl-sn-glycerol-3-phosphate acyltransferase
MRDGKVNRAIRERVPELRERVPELKDGLRSRGSELARQYAKMDVSWARCSYAKAARAALLGLGLGPMIDYYVRNRVVGAEIFDELDHPVIFVANHSSHLDTPTILRAIPHHWRTKTAVAAAADYFYRVPWLAYAVSLAFNTIPVERKGEAAVPDAASQLVRLLDDGWSLLVFAEGTRSRDGTIGRLRSGAAVLAAEHGLAIVPVHVAGTHAVMPPGSRWMRRARGTFKGARQPIAVSFGPPVRAQDGEHRTDTMERVRLFFDASGAVTTPDKRIEARDRRSASPPSAT